MNEPCDCRWEVRRRFGVLVSGDTELAKCRRGTPLFAELSTWSKQRWGDDLQVSGPVSHGQAEETVNWLATHSRRAP